MLPAYAELLCCSNYHFLHGASHPEELVVRATELGYTALALTDECSVAGVVRAHEEVRKQQEKGMPIRLIVGTTVKMANAGPQPAETDPTPTTHVHLLLLARTREAYGHLCELITLGRSRRPKGEYHLSVDDVGPTPPPGLEHLHGLPDCWAVLLPRREDPDEVWHTQTRWLQDTFGDRARLGGVLSRAADDALHQSRLDVLSRATDLPCVALGDVQMHVRSRKPLHDTLTAIREHLPIADCGHALSPNAEQHLRSRLVLATLYPREWLAESVRMAEACTFELSELKYEYPQEIVPPGHTLTSWLRHETYCGLVRRYAPGHDPHAGTSSTSPHGTTHTHEDSGTTTDPEPQAAKIPVPPPPHGVPPEVLAQIEKELTLIADLRYEAFFLTVHDLVRFARSQGILCQGRGSAANSVVCWCLGITEVDPTEGSLLFERFISRERGEPPDIDVDFEHERREEVIQYIHRKYGRHRTALAAAVATYRVRGAVRDVGAALGLDARLIDAVAKSYQWFDGRAAMGQRLAEHGLDLDAPVTRHWMELTTTLLGFPRHLSQHSGGFVISSGPLARLVPIEPAAMEGRQVIQWDKDDLESLGLLKVDVLALGMLTVLRRTLDLVNNWNTSHHPQRAPLTLQAIPRDCPATWAMIQRADTIGTFQIESRAQMSMLPRLKPEKFYDLVIEVAIVRPGPIQGGMVHPYLRRKQGKESAESPYPDLDQALKRTLGVPIFQEQVMQVCMIAAGFTPGEADGMRRAMAAWRRKGGVEKYQDRVIEGMVDRGYAREFAEGIFRQIQGFGEYGFPESHAYGFALLAWFSAWLKCHEPAAFLAALLNSQPMGFYGPSQLVQDARRHGVEVRPVDVGASDWDCTLEVASPTSVTDPFDPARISSLLDTPDDVPVPAPAVRLGLRLVKGLSPEAAQRLTQARVNGPWQDVQDLARRADLDPRELQALAQADALQSLAGHRRAQLWAAAAPRAGTRRSLLHEVPVHEPELFLPEAPCGEAVVLDYRHTGLSLRAHPVALLRERLKRQSVRSAAELARTPHGRIVRACGLVTTRQQPGTAGGTVFVTLEDETGPINVIVWKDVREAFRQALIGSRLLAVVGQWQRTQGVSHLVARRLIDATRLLDRELGHPQHQLQARSRDFH